MYINKFKVENFKILKSREFKFNKINLLEGSNGFGKSSVFDAIVFLLTNTVDAKIEEYINWDADKFKIEADLLDYSGNKINYFIQQSKTMKRVLKTEVDEYKQSAATQYMHDIINPNIALYSNISVQQKSTQLLFEKSAPRLEKFKLLFGINDIDAAVNNIKEEISELKNKIENVVSEIEFLKEKKFEYIEEEIIGDYSSLQSEVDLLSAKKEKYEVQKKLYSAYVIALVEYKDKIKIKKSLVIKLDELETKLFDLDKEYSIVVITTLDDLKSKEIEIVSKLKKLDSDKILSIDLNFKINNLIKKISDLGDSKDNYIIQRIKPFEYTDEYRKELLRIQSSQLSEYLKLEGKYKAIKDGKCPTCEAEYSSDNIEEIKIRTDLIKKEYETTQFLILGIDEEEKVYNEKINQNKIAKSKLESIDSQIKSCQNEIESYKEQLNKIDLIEDKDELLKKGAQIKKDINEIENYNKKYSNIEKEILITNTKLENYNDISKPIEIEEPVDFDVDYFEDKKKDLYVFIEKENNLKKIQELNEKTKIDEKNNIELIIKKENSIDKDRKELRLLETSKKILSKDFTSYLIDWGTEYTKTKMNEIFQKSYGRYNVTLNRDVNGKGVDFYYFSNKNQKMTNVNLASGYEKQLLSVSFRMALASLHKLGIFIFDEIDSDSNEENSLRLYKVILAQTFKQIFVVTHKEGTKDYLRSLPECSTFEF